MSTVLKAQLTRSAGQARALHPAPNAAVQAPLTPGRWMSESDLDALLAQAFEDGLHRGRQQGEQQEREAAQRDAEHRAKQALDRALADHQARAQRLQGETWRSLAATLADQLQALKTQLEAEVTEWTFVAATRLLGQASEEQVQSAVRQVLAQARLRGPVQVLVHADDLALLTHDAAEWAEGVSFAADPAVALGGCLVRSPHETVDARVEVQLQFLRDALDAARRDRQAAES